MLALDNLSITSSWFIHGLLRYVLLRSLSIRRDFLLRSLSIRRGFLLLSLSIQRDFLLLSRITAHTLLGILSWMKNELMRVLLYSTNWSSFKCRFSHNIHQDKIDCNKNHFHFVIISIEHWIHQIIFASCWECVEAEIPNEKTLTNKRRGYRWKLISKQICIYFTVSWLSHTR